MSLYGMQRQAAEEKARDLETEIHYREWKLPMLDAEMNVELLRAVLDRAASDHPNGEMPTSVSMRLVDGLSGDDPDLRIRAHYAEG